MSTQIPDTGDMSGIKGKVLAALGEAENEAKTKKPGKKNTNTGNSAPRNITDILASIREARKARLEQQTQAAQIVPNEELLDAFQELADREKVMVSRYETFQGGQKDPEIDPALLNNAIASTEKDLRQVREDQEILTKECPTLLEYLIKRKALCRETVALLRKLDIIDPKAIKSDIVAEFIRDAVSIGAIAPSDTGPVQWAGRFYAPTATAPEVAKLTEELSNFIASFASANDARKKAFHERISPFLIGTRRDGENPSELEALKDTAGTCHSLTEFLGGKGTRAFVPVNEQDEGARFLGEAMLERTSEGSIFCTKASEALVNRLFFYNDKQKDKIVKRGAFVVETNGTDCGAIRSNLLREGMKAKLAREATSAKKRDAADNLRDISKVTNPVTIPEIIAGKAGTAIVDVRDEKDLFLTFHLESDGKSFSVSSNLVPGSLEREPWLKEFLTPAKHELGVLTRDKRWVAIKYANLYTDRDWQLEKAAKKLEAVLLSKENCDELLSETGKNGTYSFYAEKYNPVKETRTPQGFVVERKDASLKFVYAVPGSSAESIKDNILDKELPMDNNLPKTVRAILRGVYMRLKGLRGKNGLAQVPAYLKDAPVPEDNPNPTDQSQPQS